MGGVFGGSGGGIAALKETEYGARLRSLIGAQRPILTAGLKECGCRVIPGAANYLLFYYPDEQLGEKMKQKGRDAPGLPELSRTEARAGIG